MLVAAAAVVGGPSVMNALPRPIPGCVFGGLVAMNYVAGLIPVQPPNPSDEARFAFLAVLGFAAGFSERLAQDMLIDVAPMIGLKRGQGDVA